MTLNIYDFFSDFYDGILFDKKGDFSSWFRWKYTVISTIVISSEFLSDSLVISKEKQQLFFIKNVKKYHFSRDFIEISDFLCDFYSDF